MTSRRHTGVVLVALGAVLLIAAARLQALSGSQHRGHLVADVPALFIAAAVLSALTPRRSVVERAVEGS